VKKQLRRSVKVGSRNLGRSNLTYMTFHYVPLTASSATSARLILKPVQQSNLKQSHDQPLTQQVAVKLPRSGKKRRTETTQSNTLEQKLDFPSIFPIIPQNILLFVITCLLLNNRIKLNYSCIGISSYSSRILVPNRLSFSTLPVPAHLFC
jgi:hypothetical protein